MMDVSQCGSLWLWALLYTVALSKVLAEQRCLSDAHAPKVRDVQSYP